MERVETLLQKLSEQFNEGANSSQLLLTVQMLQQELLYLQKAEGVVHPSVANVHIPTVTRTAISSVGSQLVTELKEEKILQTLQVDEAEIEAELEEIKRKAETVGRMSLQSRTQVVFEMLDEEVPTLVHQRKNNEKKDIQENIVFESINTSTPEVNSLNDALKNEHTELSVRLNESPIKDLRKAIGINDRFVYINELFRGDETMYERSIKTINSFSIWPEAEYWIRRELKIKLGWQDNYELVKQFDQLVKRRFS